MQYGLYLNPRSMPSIGAPPSPEVQPIDYHRTVPGYSSTPLLELPTVAGRLGVKRVLLKDESTRMGLPSFKMLGASWATAYAVREAWLGGLEGVLSPAQLSELIPDRATKRLVAATDGNHGRGVARMARFLGVGCLIFVPSGTASSRITAIESEGAEVQVVSGSYDDAIRRSAEEADAKTVVVSDTSWDGYQDIPEQVTRGYSTMFTEIDEALDPTGSVPTLVVMQAGVGSFAAAGLLHYRTQAGHNCPATLIVEPRSANCLYLSARAGEVTEAPPPHESTMAGLNCGLPSRLVWPIIDETADAFVWIEDEAAHEAMRLLAVCGIAAGESGAAGLGGLLTLAEATSGDADRVGLNAEAVVLVVNTEGATDPVNYKNQVGVTADQVIAEAGSRRQQSGVVTL